MYSSNKNHGSEMKFRNALEHLLYKYKVDLVLYGHVHGMYKKYIFLLIIESL